MVSMPTALTLRQEGQQQALATTDSFILFLQNAPGGMMPHLIKRTAEWKKEVEEKKASTALKHTLFQNVMQQLLDRILRLAQAPQGHEILKEQHQVIDDQRQWPYLQ